MIEQLPIPAASPDIAVSLSAVRQIAHDLNNALTTVSGYAQLLESDASLPARVQRSLQTIERDATRAQLLVEQLLLLSQKEDNGRATDDHNTPCGTLNASCGTLDASCGTLTAIPDVAPRSLRVLVVDDEEPVITLIGEILALDNHHITPAFNGAEALALLGVEEFDLIISDVRMPAVGGPPFAEILRTQRTDLLSRVIFVTGDTVSLSTRHFLHDTARPVLVKPFSPDRLRALVAQFAA